MDREAQGTAQRFHKEILGGKEGGEAVRASEQFRTRSTAGHNEKRRI